MQLPGVAKQVCRPGAVRRNSDGPAQALGAFKKSPLHRYHYQPLQMHVISAIIEQLQRNRAPDSHLSHPPKPSLNSTHNCEFRYRLIDSQGNSRLPAKAINDKRCLLDSTKLDHNDDELVVVVIVLVMFPDDVTVDVKVQATMIILIMMMATVTTKQSDVAIAVTGCDDDGVVVVVGGGAAAVVVVAQVAVVVVVVAGCVAGKVSTWRFAFGCNV